MKIRAIDATSWLIRGIGRDGHLGAAYATIMHCEYGDAVGFAIKGARGLNDSTLLRST